jgi:acetyl esterase/lipase
MKQILYIFLVALIPDFCAGQNAVLPLWEGAIPNQQPSNEVEVRDSTDIVFISNVIKPDIALFLPSKKLATGQAVIICPGGGYRVVAHDWEGTDVAKWLNGKGIAALVLKYRLPVSKNNIVPHRSPLLDAQRAIRLTRFHANEWNIDADKIGIMGFSAGGHLASTAGTHFDCGDSKAADPVEKMSCRPDFMVLIYPVITLTQTSSRMRSKTSLIGDHPDDTLVAAFSNELHVTNDAPPAFLVHCGDDEVVPVENSLLFYRALLSQGIPAELHLYPTGGHGFSLAVNHPNLENWTECCIDWLRNLPQP